MIRQVVAVKRTEIDTTYLPFNPTRAKELRLAYRFPMGTTEIPIPDVPGVTPTSSILTVPDSEISAMSGLGPVGATLDKYENGLTSGITVYNSQVENRVISIQFELYPTIGSTNSFSEARHRLYMMFAPGELVELYFDHSLYGWVYIAGVVEAVDAPIFTPKPNFGCSIVCEEPYFVSLDDPVEVLIEDRNPDYPEVDPQIIDYNQGTAPTGFEFSFTYMGKEPISDLDRNIVTILRRSRFVGSASVGIDTAAASANPLMLQEGDGVFWSSDPRMLAVWLYSVDPFFPDREYQDLSPFLTTYSELSSMFLIPGENKIFAHARPEFSDATIHYFPRYLGL